MLAVSGGAGAGPAATVRVTFAPLPFGIVTSQPAADSGPCTSHEGTDCSIDVPVGTDVSLTAALDPDETDPLAAGQRFYGWSTPECGSDATCTLKGVTEAVTAYALFAPALFEVRVAGAGTVTSTGDVAVDCADDCRYAFPPGKSFTLTATPANPGDAVEWVFGCEGDDTHASTCATRTEDRVVGVRFGAVDPPTLPFDVSVALHVSKQGSGTVSGSGIDCGASCTSDPALPFGTRVKLTATPASGSRFDHWVGAPCSAATTCTFNVGPVTGVRAVFAEAPPPPPPSPPPPTTTAPPPPPPPTTTTAPPSEPTPPPPTKATTLVVRMGAVTVRRGGGSYRVSAAIVSNERANVRLVVQRGATILGLRGVLVPAGRATVSVQLSRTRIRPGPASLWLRARDAGGHGVTISRRITLGR